MNDQKQIIQLTIATVLLLTIGLFLPDSVAIGLSVIYFAAVTWYKPKLLIPLLILYFPFRPFLVEINDGLKFAGDVGILVLVIKVVVDAIKQKDYKSLFQLEWYEWAYLGFCLVGAISALTTGVSLVAIVFQLRKFLTMYLLYYGIKRLAWNRTEMLNVLKIISGVAIVLIAHGFVEKLSQRQWLIPQAWKEMFISPANFERIYGLLSNPNSMSMYMVVAIAASFTLLRVTKKKAWYIPLVLEAGTLLLTYSRGTIIGITIAGIIFLFLAKDKQITKQAIIAALAGFLLVFLPVHNLDRMIAEKTGQAGQQQQDGSGSLGDRFSSSFDEEQFERSLNTGRIFFVKVGLDIWTDYPAIGTGFGTFGDSAALVYSSPIYDDYGLKDIYDYMGTDFYSDNQYIQIIVQTGTIGTILFAIFMLNMAFRMGKLRKTDPALSHVTLFFWLYVGLVGVVYNVWENQVFPMFFFALLAWMETVKRGRSDSLSPAANRKEETS
ncbi:O-antigen ligase family protein [Lentibacillus lipolyticus]|nr:O-antigen ligase family protein [Lentibacillus lipolyticus]